MSNPIKKILIVGGGSSGWLTAAFLQRMINRQDPHRVEISLIESPEIGILGVGEATVPTLRATLAFLGIDEFEFMRRAHATLKQAVRFDHWRESPSIEPGNYYYHPFDRAPLIDGLPAHLALADSLRKAGPQRFAYELSVQPWLCDAGRSPKLPGDPSYQAPVGYAYHMDAVLMGRYLKELSIERGVIHIEDKVERASRSADGAIAALHTESGRTLEADLYIDCSGFRSLLLKGVFDAPFTSYSDSLFCDRAIAMQVPTDPKSEILPYTKTTAMSSGWIWEVQLQGRRGVGHVYSSSFIDDEAAERELRSYIGPAAEGVNSRVLKLRVGRSEEFWVKNCVGIGLSSGFIEPLESTGIYLIEIAVKALVDNLTLDGIQEPCIRNYNQCMGKYFDEIRDFIVMHYCLTNREDTEFWRANKFNKALPESLKNNLALWENRYPSPFDDSKVGDFFNYETYVYILGGMGKLPALDLCYSGHTDAGKIKQRLMDLSKWRDKALQLSPSHREYISQALGKQPAM